MTHDDHGHDHSELRKPGLGVLRLCHDNDGHAHWSRDGLGESDWYCVRPDQVQLLLVFKTADDIERYLAKSA